MSKIVPLQEKLQNESQRSDDYRRFLVSILSYRVVTSSSAPMNRVRNEGLIGLSLYDRPPSPSLLGQSTALPTTSKRGALFKWLITWVTISRDEESLKQSSTECSITSEGHEIRNRRLLFKFDQFTRLVDKCFHKYLKSVLHICVLVRKAKTRSLFGTPFRC